ncbi:ABC transporter permease [Acidobacteria bacterium AH-259-L09]|nr:ABC transporter permease [Acidobacteria bacterium AH-259-L09]
MSIFRGFAAVLHKETIQIRRDTFALFLILVLPMFQLLMFGYAIDTNVRNIRTAVYNLDKSRASREILDAFTNTDYFEIVRFAESDRELNDLIISGRVKVGIKIPPDYSKHILNGRQATVLVLIDGSDSSIASRAINASTAVGLRRSLQQLALNQFAQAKMLPIEVRPKMLFNPDMRSANFMVPGLIAIILQIITTFLTAFSVVRERERGTLEQLLVTPIKPLGLMLGKLTPYCVISFLEMCSVLVIMRIIFLVPISGNLLLLLLTTIPFLFTALGIGLLISTIAKNQVQAMQMAYFVILPSILLSGFMFPRGSMPVVMQWVAYFIPATYFIEIMRGIVLRGAGFLQLWPNVLALVIMGGFILGVSTFRFQRRLG